MTIVIDTSKGAGKRLRRKRRAAKRINTGRVPKAMRTPVPIKMFVKLTYAEVLTLTPTAAGTSDSMVYSANNWKDPNVSGGGHKPRGYNELMSLYDHYVGTTASITCQAMNRGNVNANDASWFMIRLKDNSVEDLGIINHVEASYTKYTCIPVSRAENCTRLTNQANVAKFLGRSNPLSDPDLKGSTATEPKEQCYFHIGAQGLNQGTIGNQVDVLVTIQYAGFLIEPKNPSQST